MPIDLQTITVIAGMAAVTAATRYAGYAALGGRRLSARFKASLEAMPSAILAAIVAPVVLSGAPAETLAAVATLVVAWRAPAILAIIAGIATIVLARMVLG